MLMRYSKSGCFRTWEASLPWEKHLNGTILAAKVIKGGPDMYDEIGLSKKTCKKWPYLFLMNGHLTGFELYFYRQSSRSNLSSYMQTIYENR